MSQTKILILAINGVCDVCDLFNFLIFLEDACGEKSSQARYR